MKIKDLIGRQVLVFDGAMGTKLQAKGLALGSLSELVNIQDPRSIVDIHRDYIEAGAHIITTNSFGANRVKLANTPYKVDEVVGAAVENALEARKGSKAFVALGLGPIGQLLEPMGSLSFEEAYEIFKEQILAGLRPGVDLILIETMTDLYEAKAAILAAKENSNLPVFCTMTFEENQRSFTGTSLESMVLSLEGLGVDALGINCSLGPKETGPLISRLMEICNIPVLVQPNAGLPQFVNGATNYSLGPQEFSDYLLDFIDQGVALVGGCCGTNETYIEALVSKLGGRRKLVTRTINRPTGVCSASQAVFLDQALIVGERINPSGKKLIKQALRENNLDPLLREAIAQFEAGAHILDINLGLPGINEEAVMVKLIKEIQAIITLPLQIDSVDPKVLEAGLRAYNGKAIVNSVNAKDDSLDQILPIVKKYGAAVIGLTLDENGLAKTSQDRLRLAEKILNRALEYGIPKEDVIIDCLALTISAEQDQALESLDGLRLVKEKLGLKTCLGVSNISFGLPNRPLINRAFLNLALAQGLDLAIIDPLDQAMLDMVQASRLILNQDRGSQAYIERFGQAQKRLAPVLEQNLSLEEIILKGLKDQASRASQELLKDYRPLEIINQFIIPTLDQVGASYEAGEIFLPQLIQASETVRQAFEVLKLEILNSSRENISRGKVVLATVQGDIHDIGKNIVKVLLESYNFQVIDLGKDVSPQTIVETVLKEQVKLVGLSALMTTTVLSMEKTIEELRKIRPDLKIMVGGAVLTRPYAKEIGADYYARDGKSAVEIAIEVLES